MELKTQKWIHPPMVTWSPTKELKPSSGKKTAFSSTVLILLEVSMQKDENWSILFSLYKAQVQLDQGPPHETSYSETNRRVIGEGPRTHGHRGNFPEQNTNSLCSKIKNWHMDLWWNHHAWPKAVLQSNCDINRMVLVQWQAGRSMELNWRTRNEPAHLWSLDLWQRRNHPVETRQHFHQLAQLAVSV